MNFQKNVQSEAGYWDKVQELAQEIKKTATEFEIEAKTDEKRSQMEIEITQLYQNEKEFEGQVNELKLEIAHLQDKQKHVKALEMEKDELELSNKQLLNKIVKIQTREENNQASTSQVSANPHGRFSSLEAIHLIVLNSPTVDKEKAKIPKQMSQMKIEIKQLYQKEKEFERQVKDLKFEIAYLHDRQKYVEALEMQKNELKSSNIQLMKKIVKMQTRIVRNNPTLDKQKAIMLEEISLTETEIKHHEKQEELEKHAKELKEEIAKFMKLCIDRQLAIGVLQTKLEKCMLLMKIFLKDKTKWNEKEVKIIECFIASCGGGSK